jgi:putative hydrolase of the HAD superfamily
MSAPASIRAVTFDVGGTLIEPWPSVGHAYAHVAARHGDSHLDPAALTREFVLAWGRRPADFDYSRAAWASVVERTFSSLSPLARDEAFFADLYDHFSTPDPWRVYDDVRPVLQTLRGYGLKLAVLSNWDDRLRPLLDALDLTPHFDHIIVSGELGVHKPAPRIFRHALDALGLEANAVFHVGDSAEEDIAGALGAGLAAARIDRAADRSDERTIRSLAELPGRLSPRR